MTSSIRHSLWQRMADALKTKFFRRWIIACVAAMLLTAGLFLVVLSLVLLFTNPTWLVVTDTGLELAINLILGTILGCCQWSVLRKHFHKAYGWIVATAIGHIAIWPAEAFIVTPMLSTFADPAVWDIASVFRLAVTKSIATAICAGVVIGAAQWLFLRSRRIKKAFLWIWISIGAQLLACVVPSPDFLDFAPQADVLISASMPVLHMLFLFHTLFQLVMLLIALVAMGVIYGFPTGILLLELVANKQRQQDSTGAV